MKPPSMQILEERLRARSTETEESLQKRLKTAEIEMNYGMLDCNTRVRYDILLILSFLTWKQEANPVILISPSLMTN